MISYEKPHKVMFQTAFAAPLAIICSLCILPVASARTITVETDGTGDYPTIQDAIDDANDGDVVVVKPGTYTGDGNRDIDFRGKAITVRSEQGPATCIIDCQGSREKSHQGFHFQSGEDASSVLDGFTVTGGYHNHAAAVNCDRSSPRIINCVISANGGAGISLFRSDVFVSNCLVIGNQGTAIACTHSDPVFLNCTIAGNREGGVYSSSGRGKICLKNSIITDNTMPAQWVGTQVCVAGCTKRAGCVAVEIRNCCIENDPNAIFVEAWGSPPEPPVGTCSYITADPKFAEPGYWDPNQSPDKPPDYPYDDFWVDGDYHLKSQAGRWDSNSERWIQDGVTSPCIDAGAPDSPVGNEPFPNGGIINMGAYGGTAEASKSYFGEPVCETTIAGDINGDCRVDFADFGLMALHWLEDIGP